MTSLWKSRKNHILPLKKSIFKDPKAFFHKTSLCIRSSSLSGTFLKKKLQKLIRKYWRKSTFRQNIYLLSYNPNSDKKFQNINFLIKFIWYFVFQCHYDHKRNILTPNLWDFSKNWIFRFFCLNRGFWPFLPKILEKSNFFKVINIF